MTRCCAMFDLHTSDIDNPDILRGEVFVVVFDLTPQQMVYLNQVTGDEHDDSQDYFDGISDIEGYGVLDASVGFPYFDGYDSYEIEPHNRRTAVNEYIELMTARFGLPQPVELVVIPYTYDIMEFHDSKQPAGMFPPGVADWAADNLTFEEKCDMNYYFYSNTRGEYAKH